MESLVDQEFQQEFCESNLNPRKVAHGEVDDDGKPKRTGISLSLCGFAHITKSEPLAVSNPGLLEFLPRIMHV